MKTVILLISSIFLAACSYNGSYEKYLSQGESDYAKQCRMAYLGDREAIRSMLMDTKKYDGEDLLQHSTNLVIIQNKNPKIFEKQFCSLSVKDKQFIESIMSQGKKMLRKLP